ncbi:MAG: hypothetical protein PHW62_04070 [Candidatus Ratteibacteria bacterium]|nr:hypothetical protein [Candidatus Ratteibacteria bacterium]
MTVRIIGRKEDPNRKINTHYLLSDGRLYTREEILEMWKRRLLPGYRICKRDDLDDICDNPHTKEDDNIDNQPLI